MIRDIANWRQTGTLGCPPDGQSDEIVFHIGEDDLQEAETAHAKKRRSNFSSRKRFMSRTSPSTSLAVIKAEYHTPDTSGFKLNDEGELELHSAILEHSSTGQLDRHGDDIAFISSRLVFDRATGSKSSSSMRGTSWTDEVSEHQQRL